MKEGGLEGRGGWGYSWFCMPLSWDLWLRKGDEEVGGGYSPVTLFTKLFPIRHGTRPTFCLVIADWISFNSRTLPRRLSLSKLGFVALIHCSRTHNFQLPKTEPYFFQGQKNPSAIFSYLKFDAVSVTQERGRKLWYKKERAWAVYTVSVGLEKIAWQFLDTVKHDHLWGRWGCKSQVKRV